MLSEGLLLVPVSRTVGDLAPEELDHAGVEGKPDRQIHPQAGAGLRQRHERTVDQQAGQRHRPDREQGRGSPQNAGHLAQGHRPSTYRSISGIPKTHLLTCDYRGYGLSSLKNPPNIPTERGLIIETAGAEDEVVKLLPPLVVTDEAIDRALEILNDAADSIGDDMVDRLRAEREEVRS